jgi:hypothetical protein
MDEGLGETKEIDECLCMGVDLLKGPLRGLTE